MKEELIKKWLNDKLTPEELEAFKQLDEYSSLLKISEKAKYFKAPEFDQQRSFEELELKTSGKAIKYKPSYARYIAAIAAVFVVSFILFKTLGANSVKTYETFTAKTKVIDLPDQSKVTLNANSQISYDPENWASQRKLRLEGEAYFKVQKGSKFKVKTNYGTVEVLGTIFNVKTRGYDFEVTCFEGSVAVKLEEKSFILEINDKLILEDDKVVILDIKATKPDWKQQKTVLKNKSLAIVLKEFENYYDVEFNASEVDTSMHYTGSFTHNDMKVALNSISLPLGLTYNIDGKKIFLSKK